jgi:hypothetical protein
VPDVLADALECCASLGVVACLTETACALISVLQGSIRSHNVSHSAPSGALAGKAVRHYDITSGKDRKLIDTNMYIEGNVQSRQSDPSKAEGNVVRRLFNFYSLNP